jgi:RNA polymerase sigma-70 factor (ECF subfamily)
MRTERNQPHKDHHYIGQTLKGDLKSFSVLVDRYKHMVYTLAVRMLRNHEMAEEVSQDTFVKAYKGLSGFSGKSAFSTWIYKIAYNQSLDYLKKEKRGPKFIISDSAGLRHRAVISEADLKLESDDLKETIRQGLEALSPEDSLIITLYYLEEQNLEEISNILGISTNTAKVRLHRSRKRLAAIMKQNIEFYKAHGYG